MNTDLITGVGGFVGQQLAAKLLENGSHVIGVDIVRRSSPLDDHPNFGFIEADLTSIASVKLIPLSRINRIFHLAAAGVKVATRKWDVCMRVNIVGTANLIATVMEILRGKSAPMFLYPKTYYEDHLDLVPAFSENPYVVSKVAATRIIEALAPCYGGPIRIAKAFQVYGAGDDPNNVLSYAARTLKAGDSATFGSGNSLRDWIYIDDFIDGLIACANISGSKLCHYDLGSGQRYSLREVVEKIGVLCEASSEQMIFDPSRDRGDINIEDCAKNPPADWKPRYNLQDGLANLVSQIP